MQVELNWTTISLEIVNFLVLVWILKRFLYRPVLQVIAERRTRIEGTLSEARQRQEQAEQLRVRYENRLAEWQVEKQAAREAMQREIQQQRVQALQALETSLAGSREKARVVEERRLREIEERSEREALELAARFAARLLRDLAGPELEARILARLGDDLAHLPEEQRRALRHAIQNGAGGVQVESAHRLDPAQREILDVAVRELLGDDVHCRFRERPSLIAGLRLSLGDWSVAVNLGDELKGFVDLARDID
jgi:F-type H+-transporting ATPase subunit b